MRGIDQVGWVAQVGGVKALFFGCLVGILGWGGFAFGQDGAHPPDSAFDVTLREFGVEELAYLSLPDVRPSLGVLMVAGPRGLDREIRQIADDLARRGMIVLVLDFYGGRVSVTPAEREDAQKGVSERYSISVVQAGMRLFAESPRYQMDKVVVAVWEGNMNFVLKGLRRAQGLERLVGLCSLEPSGELDAGLWEGYRVPGLFVVNTEVGAGPPPSWRQGLQALQARRGAEIRVIESKAGNGFLLRAGSEEMAQTWTEVARQWLRWAGEAENAAPKGWLSRVWDTVTP